MEKLKTVSKKYSILHGKRKEEKEDINKKQIQIEKIKKIFRDNDINEKNNIYKYLYKIIYSFYLKR